MGLGIGIGNAILFSSNVNNGSVPLFYNWEDKAVIWNLASDNWENA